MLSKGSAKKKPRKKKRPFWKKLDPEFKHIADHIGKIIDNSDLTQTAEFLLMAGLAYQGYKMSKTFAGTLAGPLSLKLAQSENLAAGAAGVAGLVAFGLATISTDVDKPFLLAGEVPEGYETYWIAPFIYGTRPIGGDGDDKTELPNIGEGSLLPTRGKLPDFSNMGWNPYYKRWYPL